MNRQVFWQRLAVISVLFSLLAVTLAVSLPLNGIFGYHDITLLLKLHTLMVG